MFFKFEKDENKSHFFIFGKAVYYRKIENGIKTSRFLCFRKKSIQPEFFIEERNRMKRLEGVVSLLSNKDATKAQDKIVASSKNKTNVLSKNKKLSVVIPMFNTGNYVKRCIQSIQTQSYKDIEIIVIDDASTDGCAEIVSQLQKEDKRIILLKNTENSGSGISRNKGISIATGEYITFIDSDDYLYYKNYFADCLRIIKKEKCDCVITPFIREKKGDFKFDNFEFDEVVSGKEACSLYLSRKLGTHASCGKFFKTEFVKKNKFNEYGFSQDVPFVSETLISTNKVKLYKKYGYIYFNDNNSAWRPSKLTDLHFYSSFRLLLDILIFQKRLQNKGIFINTVAFHRIWLKEHGKRIKEFLNQNDISENAFIESIVEIIKQVQPTLSEEILPKDLFGLLNQQFSIKNKLNNSHEINFIKNLETQELVLKRLQNKESITIYISHLSNGGLERVASELSFVLHDLGYDVHFLLDRVKNVDYAYYGDIHKADISDKTVKDIIKNSKFIFDFKFKSLDGDFPVVKYIIENCPEKYIATIHNTKTCKNYFEKTKEYLRNNSIETIKGVLCVSNAVRSEFVKTYGSSENLQTLHNFVDHYKSLSNAIKPFNFLPEKYLLFAGRLDQTEHKGIDILIESFDKAKIPDDVKLILCGSGEIQEKVRQLIINSKKKERIVILPFEKNVFPLMMRATALLAPSRWEGFSMVHLEALSVGTPVISTLCGGAAEIIQPGINGFLSPVEDIGEFSKNIEKSLNYQFDSEKIRKTVLNFTRESYKFKLNSFLMEK